MTDELPPLPEPAIRNAYGMANAFAYGYHADQMSAYGEACARAAVLAERERCAKVCEEIETAAWKEWKATYNTYHDGRSDGAGECAAAIRAETKSPE